MFGAYQGGKATNATCLRILFVIIQKIEATVETFFSFWISVVA